MISETSNNIIIERKISGKPNAGKILVAVGANITDIPIYLSGTCAKLMDEGYKGYFIRISNDELYGDGSIFQNIHSNETETMNSAKALGFSEIFNLYYQNHPSANDQKTHKYHKRYEYALNISNNDHWMIEHPD